MKSAVVVGYHGHKNLGDDIFLKILLNWMSVSLSVKSCSVSAKKNSIKKLIFGVNVSTFENPVKNIGRFLWLPIFFKSLRSDYLIFAAGSIFTIQPFFIMYCTLRLLKIIRGNRLNIMAVAVSIGPFKSEFDKYWCLKSLNLMGMVMLRDEKSSDILKSSKLNIPYTLSYDLALSWYKVFPELVPQGQCDTKLIGLALTSRGFGDCTENGHSNVCESIILSIGRAINQYDKVSTRIFCICNDSRDGDLEICRHISNRLTDMGIKSEIVIYDGGNINDYLSSISECALMIALRMHAGIMATCASIPVYQISYAEKITSFYEHCMLSTEYMYSHNEVKYDDIYKFISNGLSGKLADFADKQSTQLSVKGEIVYSDLMKLS